MQHSLFMLFCIKQLEFSKPTWRRYRCVSHGDLLWVHLLRKCHTVSFSPRLREPTNKQAVSHRMTKFACHTGVECDWSNTTMYTNKTTHTPLGVNRSIQNYKHHHYIWFWRSVLVSIGLVLLYPCVFDQRVEMCEQFSIIEITLMQVCCFNAVSTHHSNS